MVKARPPNPCSYLQDMTDTYGSVAVIEEIWTTLDHCIVSGGIEMFLQSSEYHLLVQYLSIYW